MLIILVVALSILSLGIGAMGLSEIKSNRIIVKNLSSDLNRQEDLIIVKNNIIKEMEKEYKIIKDELALKNNIIKDKNKQIEELLLENIELDRKINSLMNEEYDLKKNLRCRNKRVI